MDGWIDGYYMIHSGRLSFIRSLFSSFMPICLPATYLLSVIFLSLSLSLSLYLFPFVIMPHTHARAHKDPLDAWFYLFYLFFCCRCEFRVHCLVLSCHPCVLFYLRVPTLYPLYFHAENQSIRSFFIFICFLV